MKKEKIWTVEEATSFIEFLDEYDMIDYISEPRRNGGSWTYTIRLKINDKSKQSNS